MSIKKKVLAVAMVTGVTLGTAGPAFGWGSHENAKCNSGRGNGSETTPANDCDPGNSGGHNSGGD
jgi:hypothetical protein